MITSLCCNIASSQETDKKRNGLQKEFALPDYD